MLTLWGLVRVQHHLWGATTKKSEVDDNNRLSFYRAFLNQTYSVLHRIHKIKVAQGEPLSRKATGSPSHTEIPSFIKMHLTSLKLEIFSIWCNRIGKRIKIQNAHNDNIVSPHILHHLYYFATPPTFQGHNFLCFQNRFCIISCFFKKKHKLHYILAYYRYRFSGSCISQCNYCFVAMVCMCVCPCVICRTSTTAKIWFNISPPLVFPPGV